MACWSLPLKPHYTAYTAPLAGLTETGLATLQGMPMQVLPTCSLSPVVVYRLLVVAIHELELVSCSIRTHALAVHGLLDVHACC